MTTEDILILLKDLDAPDVVCEHIKKLTDDLYECNNANETLAYDNKKLLDHYKEREHHFRALEAKIEELKNVVIEATTKAEVLEIENKELKAKLTPDFFSLEANLRGEITELKAQLHEESLNFRILENNYESALSKLNNARQRIDLDDFKCLEELRDRAFDNMEGCDGNEFRLWSVYYGAFSQMCVARHEYEKAIKEAAEESLKEKDNIT